MSIYVECEDPRVLTEHEHRHRQGAVQYRATDMDAWVDRHGQEDPTADPDLFAVWMASGWRYRLVFSDADAAGRGLVDYARGGARVECRAGGSWWLSDYARKGERAELAEMLRRRGDHYRVAAPVEAEPPTDPDEDALQRAYDDGFAAARAEASTGRPALPEGVVPVAWSDRCGAWIFTENKVPAGWLYVYFEDDIATWPGGWVGVDDLSTQPQKKDLVLARPVPEPTTERVPWWVAVDNRRTAACGVKVEGSRWDAGVLVLIDESENEIPGASRAADGTVEVLRDGEP